MRYTEHKTKSTLFGALVLALFIALTAFAVDGQTQPADGQQRRSLVIRQYELTERPRAGYTRLARENKVEGTVRLRVTLLANGEIGDVVPLTYLGYGLTDQAIAAAKKIRFRPKTINGVATNETITVEYNFNLYYEDRDPDIRTKVRVLETPKPAIEAAELPSAAGRAIDVEVYFGADGRVTVFRYVTDLNEDLRKRVAEAVSRITFRPAVHVNGSKMNVTRMVRYEF